MFAEPPLLPTFAPVAAQPTRIWRGRDALIGVGLLVAIFVLVNVLAVAVVVALDVDRDDEVGLSFVTASASIVFGAFLATLVLALARRRRISMAELGFRRPDRWGPVGIAVVGSYAAIIAYGAIVTLLTELGVDTHLFEGGNNIPLDDRPDGAPLVAWLMLFGIAVTIGAPLAEELFFRGLLFRALDGMWPGWIAIAVSGLAFGAFHVNLPVLIPFSIVGMLFAWSFRASGSIWVSIAAHFIINSVSFIVAVIEVLN